MSIAINYWTTGEFPEAQRIGIKRQFLEWAYFRMSWSEKAIDKWMAETETALVEGTLREQDKIFEDVYQFLHAHGMTRV